MTVDDLHVSLKEHTFDFDNSVPELVIHGELPADSPRGQFPLWIYLDDVLHAQGLLFTDGVTAQPSTGPATTEAWTLPSASAADPAGAYSDPRMTGVPIDQRPAVDNATLSPGFFFTTGTTDFLEDNHCSAGYFVTIDDQPYMVTAGHCGEPGAVAYTLNADLQPVRIGVVDDTLYDFTPDLHDYTFHGYDWAFVKLDPNVQVDPAIGGMYNVAGFIDFRTLPDGAAICRFGMTSGFQCGPFDREETAIWGRPGMFRSKTWVDSGDSGGPVFTVKDGKAYAVGITSGGGGTKDEPTFIAQEIHDVLTRNDATLYGARN